MKSYLTHVRDKKIRDGYITWQNKGCYLIKGESTWRPIVYGTKVKTLHIHSSSKIALISYFRNKNTHEHFIF